MVTNRKKIHTRVHIYRVSIYRQDGRFSTLHKCMNFWKCRNDTYRKLMSSILKFVVLCEMSWSCAVFPVPIQNMRLLLMTIKLIFLTTVITLLKRFTIKVQCITIKIVYFVSFISVWLDLYVSRLDLYVPCICVVRAAIISFALLQATCM